MKTYEYMALELDFHDLRALNEYSAAGWRVVSVVYFNALLEREREPKPTPEHCDR